MGWECRVYTAAEQDSERLAEYVPDPFLSSPRDSAGWQVERVVRRFFLPAVTGTRWAQHAADAAREFISRREGVPTAILSTYPPLGAHLAAWRLTRTTNVPWVADFRDPMANNPADDTILNPFQKWLYRRLETRFSKADLILLNTDRALEAWRQRHPSTHERAHLLWNGFDPEDRLSALPVTPGPKTLSHVGELYFGRNITPLLESFQRLIDARRISPASVRIRVVGPMRPDSIPGPKFVAKARQQGWLELFAEQVPQSEARRIAQTSDGLLIVQPHSSVQVPGKLFEYVQIGRPVLAFVPPGTPIEHILSNSRIPYECAFANSLASEIDEAIVRYLRLPSTAVVPSPWFEDTFNVQKQTQVLNIMLRTMIERRTA